MSLEALVDRVYSRPDLLECLAAAGVRLRMEHNNALIVEPLSKVTEELLMLILAKRDLLAAVLAPTPSPGFFRFPLPLEPDSTEPAVEDRATIVVADPGPPPQAFNAEAAFEANAALIRRVPQHLWPELIGHYCVVAERRYDTATAEAMARTMEAKLFGELS